MSKTKVEVVLPDKKNLKILPSGYVYYFTKQSWDSSKKRPVDNRRAIGKLSEDKTKLIPNKTYYDIFSKQVSKNEEPNTIDNYLHFGPYLALKKASNIYGLEDALRNTFPDSYKEILAFSFYMIDSNDSINQHYEKWAFSSYAGITHNMNSSSVSKLLTDITDEERIDFLKRYINGYKKSNVINTRTAIAFDSTNQNTSSSSNTYAEYGHSKVDENLPCVNTSLFVDEKTGIPLFYETFYGSLLDKTQCKHTVDYAKELGFQKAFLMMDRGYFSKENINSISQFDYAFMTPENIQTCKDLLSKYKDEIKYKENAYIKEEEVYGIKKQDVSFFDTQLNAYIYYDSKRANDEISSIHSKLEMMEKQIKKSTYYTKELEVKYGKYFNFIKKNHNRGRSKFTIIENKEIVQKEIDCAGMFVVVSNVSMSTKDMILIARKRDVSEKGFKTLKNHFDLDKTYCHSTKTYENKMFIAFVALNIIATYRYLIKDVLNNTSSETTFTSLDELAKFTIYKKSNGVWEQRYALTKKAKEIYKRLFITPYDIHFEINNIKL